MKLSLQAEWNPTPYDAQQTPIRMTRDVTDWPALPAVGHRFSVSGPSFWAAFQAVSITHDLSSGAISVEVSDHFKAATPEAFRAKWVQRGFTER